MLGHGGIAVVELLEHERLAIRPRMQILHGWIMSSCTRSTRKAEMMPLRSLSAVRAACSHLPSCARALEGNKGCQCMCFCCKQGCRSLEPSQVQPRQERSAGEPLTPGSQQHYCRCSSSLPCCGVSEHAANGFRHHGHS